MSFMTTYCGWCPCSCCKAPEEPSESNSVDSRGVPKHGNNTKPRGMTTTSLTNPAYESEDLHNLSAMVGERGMAENDGEIVIVTQPTQKKQQQQQQ